MKLSLNLLFLMFFIVCTSQTTNFVHEYIYPENKYISAIKVDYRKFSKLYKKYRKEPIADILDKIQDVKDANGYIVTTKSQIIKEIEESFFKDLEKDNNLIEFNMLKQ